MHFLHTHICTYNFIEKLTILLVAAKYHSYTTTSASGVSVPAIAAADTAVEVHVVCVVSTADFLLLLAVVCDDVDAKPVSENTQRAVPFTKCQKQSQSYCQHDLTQQHTGKPNNDSNMYYVFCFFLSLLAIAKTFCCVYPILQQ